MPATYNFPATQLPEFDFKQSARVATNAALAANTRAGNVLTADANGVLADVDGVTLVLGNRLLVKDEATGANNGIYTVTSMGAAGAPWSLTRATDADVSTKMTANMLVPISEGTANADTHWHITTNDTITLNTTALIYAQPIGGPTGGGWTDSGATVAPTSTTDQVLINAGTVGIPGLGFVGDTNLGLYRIDVDILGITSAGAERCRFDTSGVRITQTAASTGSPVALLVTGAAHTGLPTAAEVSDFFLNMAQTKEFATGAITTQRAARVAAPTYGFTGASTITTAATLAVSGAPVAGTNATITNALAFWVEGGFARFDGQILSSVGSAAAPGIAFVGDVNTGVYNIGADILGITAAGVERLRADTSGVLCAGLRSTGLVTLALTDNSATALTAAEGANNYVVIDTTNSAETVSLGNATTNPLFTFLGVGAVTINSRMTITQATSTSGSPSAFLITGAAHTTLALGAEASDVIVNLARTVQFATGAITTQRAARIAAPTYGFVGASTITTAATLAVSGAPVAGTNATITNSLAFWVEGGFARFDGQILSSGGSAAAPGISFVGDTNTGFHSASDVIACDTAGVIRWVQSDTLFRVDTLVNVNVAGSEGAVALYFFGDNNTGVFRPAEDVLAFSAGGLERLRCDVSGVLSTTLRLTQAAASSGSPTAFTVTGGAHTTLALGAEASDVIVNLARTVQFATGAITTQRAARIAAPTYGFVGASTITTAATLAVSGAPVAGTNATITNSLAFWVEGGFARFDGQILSSLGTVSAPGYAFVGDVNTGFFSVGADSVSAVANGLNRTTWNGTGIGFFATTPAAQQAGVENITNNVTAGGVDGTIANFTDLVTYANDAAAIRNDIYQLARSLGQVKNALRLYGLLS